MESIIFLQYQVNNQIGVLKIAYAKKVKTLNEETLKLIDQKLVELKKIIDEGA